MGLVGSVPCSCRVFRCLPRFCLALFCWVLADSDGFAASPFRYALCDSVRPRSFASSVVRAIGRLFPRPLRRRSVAPSPPAFVAGCAIDRQFPLWPFRGFSPSRRFVARSPSSFAAGVASALRESIRHQTMRSNTPIRQPDSPHNHTKQSGECNHLREHAAHQCRCFDRHFCNDLATQMAVIDRHFGGNHRDPPIESYPTHRPSIES